MAAQQTTTDEYPRPTNNHEALQTAIGRWIAYQHRTWEREAKEVKIERSKNWGMGLRIAVIFFAGALTAMTQIDWISSDVVGMISALLTVLTGIEGYLKLTDKAISAENRRTEIMTEYDRQGYEWMAKVQLETDTDKALEEAKRLLSESPEKINEIIKRYMTRAAGDEPTKPR